MQCKWIMTMAVVLIATILSACSSGGNCSVSTPMPSPTPEPESVTLTLSAPSTYPAGMEITAYLSIQNTSNVDAVNLTYPTITPTTTGNTTGATITFNPSGVIGNDCSVMLAGQTCVFTAHIPANSNPGSFIVSAIGDINSTTSMSSLTRSTRSKTDFIIETQVSISLVSVLPNAHSLYILPLSQTLNTNMNESMQVMFTVLIESGMPTTINVHDVNGLNEATLISSLPTSGHYQVNDVATYNISYPAGQSGIESLIATSNICESDCSNIATINFVPSGSGILNISPAVITFSESYLSQTFTLSNNGESRVTQIVLPTITEPLSIISNCGNESFTLNIESSCNFTITYTESDISGIRDYSISYNNGQSLDTQTTLFTIYYMRMPLSIIFATNNSYNGNLGGVLGADLICQNEAYVSDSIIPPGATFKALLVTSGRYPCDVTGNCGGEYASADWPLLAGEVYYNPDLTHFNTVNSNFVFDGSARNFKGANGDKIPSYEYIWSGIQSIKSSANLKDISAWAYSDVNPDADSTRYTNYSPSTCSDFTNSVLQVDVLLNSGSIGQTTIKAHTTNSEKTILANTWGNYYIFDDASGFDNIANVWVSGSIACSEPARLICVSTR